uniref:Calicivirus coat protein n=1 Tax=PNG bee virus 12 TaxID=2746871 RepID=A0A7D5BEC3_9CALI|nr:calicivirus coat protein [PNG bee virus 12]
MSSMASDGLGSTINPQGEKGTVDHVVQTQEGVKRNDNTSIQQTTSKETLNKILYGDWIYKGTYTISSSMPAGTVFAILPIHPSECNPFVAHVNKMFNAWTGGMKVRQRLIGTAFYGGSIRVGFLPPNMTETEIASLPLSVLTAYPNSDLDPKNTNWREFETSDEREVAYHYNKQYDTTDRSSFGGYVVFYVAAKLITQDPAFTSIQMLVETAGGFAFDQVNPRFLDSTSSSGGPIPTYLLESIFRLPGCDTNFSSEHDVLQVHPSNIKSLPAGFFGATGLNGRPLTSSTYVRNLPSQLQKLFDMRDRFATTSLVQGRNRDDWYCQMRTYDNSLVLSPSLEDNMRVYNTLKTTNANYVGMKKLLKYKEDIYDTFNWFVKDFDVSNENELLILQTEREAYTSTINYADYSFYENDFTTPIIPELRPEISGESIVTFGNALTPSLNISKSQIVDHFVRNPVSDLRNSYLYTLRKRSDGIPMMTLRLLPSGIFTTNATTSMLIVPVGNEEYYLSYESVLPVSDPLPSVSTEARLMKRELAHLTRKFVEKPSARTFKALQL